MVSVQCWIAPVGAGLRRMRFVSARGVNAPFVVGSGEVCQTDDGRSLTELVNIAGKLSTEGATA